MEESLNSRRLVALCSAGEDWSQAPENGPVPVGEMPSARVYQYHPFFCLHPCGLLDDDVLDQGFRSAMPV
jgi:hypothetical protein